MYSVFILFFALNGSFGISSIALPGNLRELTFFLACSNILSNLSRRVLLKVVSKSFFSKSSWLSTCTVSSTVRPRSGLIISSVTASLLFQPFQQPFLNQFYLLLMLFLKNHLFLDCKFLLFVRF